MNFQQNVPLSQYSTMRLGGNANYLTEIASVEELKQALAWADQHGLPAIMVGSGSNIVWRDEGYPGLVLINKITGFEVVDDEMGTYLTVGSGENWDSVVQRAVELDLSGIECLSLIPGTAGATPVQNVGAYGQDISQTLVTLTLFDTSSKTMLTMSASDCQFSYRSSIFKNNPGKFMITSITLMLRKDHILPPFYHSLENYLSGHGITDYSPASIRQAVIDIRRSKLPDPSQVANCGSFFANPEIDKSALGLIEENYPGVSNWPSGTDKVKLSAAWLISKAGYADFYDQETGIATWPSQPLVFINKNAASTADLLAFAGKVQAKVKEMFGVDLILEPLLLP